MSLEIDNEKQNPLVAPGNGATQSDMRRRLLRSPRRTGVACTTTVLPTVFSRRASRPRPSQLENPAHRCRNPDAVLCSTGQEEAVRGWAGRERRGRASDRGIAAGDRPWKSTGKATERTADARAARVVLGWGYQVARIFDHGEKKEIAGRFFGTLDLVLPEVPEPKQAPIADENDTAVADLERLARLHADGSLTDAEFAKAKARILDS